MTLASSTRDSGAEQVEVSVIVPARNEEAGLARCLDSLVSQSGVTFEIIVVNDHSTDRTREVAESFVTDPRSCDPHLPKTGRYGAPGLLAVRVVDAGPLPQGWYGKSNACVAGAKFAHGNWLLFTDADTFHKPGSLARAVAEAKQFGASLLSYSPEQEVHGVFERVLMPLVFAELASTYKSQDVCDPASPVAAANGQYLLITREAYDAVGGHGAVAGDLLEDVALARLFKRTGRKLRFRFGGDIVRTRMYRTFAQMREGWTKNLALLFASPAKLAAQRTLEFVASVGAFMTAIVALALGTHRTALVGAVIAVPTWLNLLRRVRKAHFDALSTLLSSLGLPLFSYLLLRSRISHKRGIVAWKGRKYGVERVAGLSIVAAIGGPRCARDDKNGGGCEE